MIKLILIKYYLLYYYLLINILCSYSIINIISTNESLIIDIIYIHFNLISISLLLIILLISTIVIYNSIDYFNSIDLILFIIYIVLFQLVMILFVISNDIILIYLNWDYLGLISYLLINWWSNRISTGLKAIIFNRFGDLSLLFMVSIYYSLFSIINWNSISTVNWIKLLISLYHFNSFSLCGINYLISVSILFILFTKSAQLPFSSWLLSAMNAPTPISALLHSSTMVIAGLYIGLIMSNSIIYYINIITYYYFSLLLFSILFYLVPLITLIYTLIKAVTSSDIKSIIALSTISQLSYMFIVLLINPITTLYHIIIHSLFKSILFILTGSLIHFNLNYQSVYRIKISTTLIRILFISSLLVLVFSLSKEVIILTILSTIYYSFSYHILLIGTVFTLLYSLRLVSIIH